MDLHTFQAELRKVRDSFDCPANEINEGWCADFATAVWENLGSPTEVGIHNNEEMSGGDFDYSHTFLSFNGMFFDSECIEGTDDWTQLPTFNRPFEYPEDWPDDRPVYFNNVTEVA